MEDCVFCNIARRIIEADILLENERLFVIRDILPKAPVHMLIIPKEHILSVNHLDAKHKELVGEMVLTAGSIATKYGISESGYKLIFNVGKDGGQIIPHLHLHLLGGKQLLE